MRNRLDKYTYIFYNNNNKIPDSRSSDKQEKNYPCSDPISFSALAQGRRGTQEDVPFQFAKAVYLRAPLSLAQAVSV